MLLVNLSRDVDGGEKACNASEEMRRVSRNLCACMARGNRLRCGLLWMPMAQFSDASKKKECDQNYDRGIFSPVSHPVPSDLTCNIVIGICKIK
jgi:hypothetical protein